MAEEKKYWIKPGIAVAHVDNDDIKMHVDKVLTSTNSRNERFTDGVLCHWFNSMGGYESGKFNTTELKPFEPNN